MTPKINFYPNVKQYFFNIEQVSSFLQLCPAIITDTLSPNEGNIWAVITLPDAPQTTIYIRQLFKNTPGHNILRL